LFEKHCGVTETWSLLSFSKAKRQFWVCGV